MKHWTILQLYFRVRVSHSFLSWMPSICNKPNKLLKSWNQSKTGYISHTHRHTHADTYKQTHTQTHTDTHTQRHTHRHADTHTQSHIHSYIQVCLNWLKKCCLDFSQFLFCWLLRLLKLINKSMKQNMWCHHCSSISADHAQLSSSLPVDGGFPPHCHGDAWALLWGLGAPVHRPFFTSSLYAHGWTWTQFQPHRKQHDGAVSRGPGGLLPDAAAKPRIHHPRPGPLVLSLHTVSDNQGAQRRQRRPRTNGWDITQRHICSESKDCNSGTDLIQDCVMFQDIIIDLDVMKLIRAHVCPAQVVQAVLEDEGWQGSEVLQVLLADKESKVNNFP